MKNSLLPIILGAFAPETDPMRLALRGRQQVLVREVGVGAIAAGVATAQLLSEIALTSNTPVVIFIGSVGSGDKNTPPGSALLVSGAKMADCERAAGRAYLPKISNDSIPADPKLLALAELELKPCPKRAFVYSSPSITADENSATILTAYAKTPFENLEIFGVASACQSALVPWIGLSVVTNHLGPNANSEWKSNMTAAAEKSTSMALQFLKALQK